MDHDRSMYMELRYLAVIREFSGLDGRCLFRHARTALRYLLCWGTARRFTVLVAEVCLLKTLCSRHEQFQCATISPKLDQDMIVYTPSHFRREFGFVLFHRTVAIARPTCQAGA